MSAQKIEIITAQLYTLDLKPGDQPVLIFPDRVTAEQVSMLREVWTSIMPNNPCLIIDGGAQLGVIRNDG